MIILDTNVLSELFKLAPSKQVITWMSQQARSALFTTTVARGEIFYGIQIMQNGQRKQGLHNAMQAVFNEDFAGHVLSFDNDAADAYATIAALRKNIGKPISQFDAMIAAIVRSRSAILATRNTKDFLDCGIEVIDPWQFES